MTVSTDERLADWAVEVTDPAPRDLGELADWAADIVEQEPVE